MGAHLSSHALVLMWCAWNLATEFPDRVCDKA
jgi:hypothetical protein